MYKNSKEQKSKEELKRIEVIRDTAIRALENIEDEGKLIRIHDYIHRKYFGF
jgi:hypothetical protein